MVFGWAEEPKLVTLDCPMIEPFKHLTSFRKLFNHWHSNTIECLGLRTQTSEKSKSCRADLSKIWKNTATIANCLTADDLQTTSSQAIRTYIWCWDCWSSNLFCPTCPLCQNMSRGTLKFSIGQTGSLLRLKDWKAYNHFEPFRAFPMVHRCRIPVTGWGSSGSVDSEVAARVPRERHRIGADQGKGLQAPRDATRCHKMLRDATRMETETETKWDVLRWFEMPYESLLAWSWFNMGSSFKLQALSQASVDSEL